ncbi:hypothetical protein D049_4847B, partial [Vibrio parahaemolyticus VPTS-2010]
FLSVTIGRKNSLVKLPVACRLDN